MFYRAYNWPVHQPTYRKNDMRIRECLCCQSKDLVKVISFPPTPLTDNYRINKKESLEAIKYECEAMFCRTCTHLQLEKQTNQEDTYKSYQYESKVTTGIDKNFSEYAKKIIKKGHNTTELSLLDVGSNDGSFIKACRLYGIRSYGIEPATALCESANKAGLPTHCGFFDGQVKLKRDSSFPDKYDVITFNNVIANMPSPKQSIEVAKMHLKDENSMICIQTGYHPKQFTKGLFDYIYHEHYSYFNYTSMRALTRACNLEIEEVEYSNLRGGSARFWLTAANKKDRIKNNPESFSCESDYKRLNELIDKSRIRIEEIIKEKLRQKLTIIGFGASHSTGMLVSKFRLDGYIDKLVDENDNKIGRYMPGTKLRVERPWTTIKKEDVVIVLAWQYYDQIKDKLVAHGVNPKNIVKPIDI